jgi:hypothetical protein
MKLSMTLRTSTGMRISSGSGADASVLDGVNTTAVVLDGRTGVGDSSGVWRVSDAPEDASLFMNVRRS